MRFALEHIPTVLYLFLPLYVAYNEHGLIWTFILMILLAGLRQFLLIKNIRSRYHHRNKLILETLPISHYVDKVRWCLDRLGVEYEEEKDAGIIGILFTGRGVPALKVPAQNMTLYNSSDILRYLYGANCKDEAKSAFLKPTKEAVELEAKIDKFGVALRRYVYYHLLVKSKNPETSGLKVWGLNVVGIPEWQKMLLKVTFPVLKEFLYMVLNVNEKGAADGYAKSMTFLKEMDSLLSDGRKYLLNTEEPTFVDITFAALAAILALPDEYGGPKALGDANRPKMEDVSLEMQKEIKAFRNTTSGKFVMKMFKEHRM